MAIKIEDLQTILIESGIKDSALRSTIIKAAQALEEEVKADKEAQKGPKAKNKFTVLIRANADQKEILENTEAFLIKSPEEVDDNDILTRMKNASLEQNRNGKQRKTKITTWAEWFRNIKGKHRKPHQVQNVGKSPVRVIVLESEDIKF
jgi:hypothetical protein